MTGKFRAEQYDESNFIVAAVLTMVWGSDYSAQSSEEGQKKGGASLCLQFVQERMNHTKVERSVKLAYIRCAIPCRTATTQNAPYTVVL